MKFLRPAAAAAMAVLLFAAPSTAAGIELTTNGDFETGDLSGWTIFDSGNSGNGGTISISSDTPDASAWSGLVESETGAPSNPTLKQERVGQGTVQNNQDVLIRFDAKGEALNGGVHIIQFFTEAGGGGASSVTNLVEPPVFLTTDWRSYEFTVNTGANDISGGVTLQFSAITGAVPGAFSSIAVDNVSLSVVPEPSSFALVGVGALGLVARRRRR